MDIVVTLVFVLVSSFIFTLVGRFFKIPDVVSLIACGLFVNISSLRNYFVEPNTAIVSILGDLAVLLLMFMTGLGSSLSFLRKEERPCTFIGFFAALATFFLVLGVTLALGVPLLAACMAGICLSITDEGTIAKYLMDIKQLKSRIGSAMVGSGVIDDFLGFGLFIAVTLFLKENYLFDDMFIVVAIAAFFAGLITQKWVRHHPLFLKFEKLSMYSIIPFFFVSIALHFSFGSLVLSSFLLVALLFAALIGKIAGTLLTRPFSKFSFEKLHIIGWGMNSRGALSMIIALIAFKNNLVSVSLYSGLVLVVVLSTLMFPFAAKILLKVNPKVLN